jgi:quercetin dioxygenase-like cupin family protein
MVKEAGLAKPPAKARIYWRGHAASTNISQYQPPRENVMPNEPVARTPGAKRAAPGEYVFDLGTVQKIMGGPAYSTAHGPCVEGDRMIVGLMRMKAGTGAEAHSHPNEQWIYVLEGTFQANIDGKEIDVPPGSVVYIPANTIHAGKATPAGDVVFFTVKDASHSLHGMKAS